METYFHGHSKEEIVELLPDTIYLPKKEIIERLPWIAEPYKDDPFWDEVYIRKDALLEWINEMREKHRGFIDTELVVTLDKLTEKINSF